MYARTRVFSALLVMVLAIMTMTTSGTVIAESDSCKVTGDAGESMSDIIDRFSRLQILQFGRGPGPTDEWREAPITRGGFAVLLVRALGYEQDALISKEDTPFSDMAEHWAAGHVTILARQGLVQGQPGGMFEPDEPLTLPQAQVILARTLRARATITMENAEQALQSAGMETRIPCEQLVVNQGQAMLLLDRAMRIPIYARHNLDE